MTGRSSLTLNALRAVACWYDSLVFGMTLQANVTKESCAAVQGIALTDTSRTYNQDQLMSAGLSTC